MRLEWAGIYEYNEPLFLRKMMGPVLHEIGDYVPIE
jgi:hypothetical protein